MASTQLHRSEIKLILKKWFQILGSLDGKHVQLWCPSNSGSLFYNYKNGFSTVLMCLADADYRIIYASFGHYGSHSDGCIFDRSDLKKKLLSGTLNIPEPTPIPGT